MSEANFDDFAGNPVNEIVNVDEDVSDVEVDIIDDRPEEDRVAPRADMSTDEDQEEINQYSGRAGKRIGQLKYEFHEERRAKEEAERMREEAVRYAQSVAAQNEELRNVVVQGESVLISEMKARGSSELDRARAEYTEAYEAGETEKLVDAQEKLFRAMRYAEQAESQTEVVPDYIKQPTPRMPAQQDPKLSEWTSKNTWFGPPEKEGTDQEMTSFAYGVHQNLVRAGINPQSQEYYRKLDERVKTVFPDRVGKSAADRGETEVLVAGQRRPSVVASASRSSSTPRKVQLTSTQVALANRLGLTKEQYAKQVLKEMRSDG